MEHNAVFLDLILQKMPGYVLLFELNQKRMPVFDINDDLLEKLNYDRNSFFKEFRRVIKDDGIVATYTSAAPVRAGFIEADFYIGLGPIFGRMQGGTLASPNPEMLDWALPKNDEIRIALSDVGIPFRDPGLNNSSEFILDARTEERHNARHNTKISSAVKTPIFLGQEMDDEKLKRRVERNLVKMNIPSTTSSEADYIVEVENDYCEKQDRENNSTNRILKMEKRLKKVKMGNYIRT